MIKSKERDLLNLISEYLEENGVSFSDLSHLDNIKARNEGKKFSFNENIRGLIYAQLSNQTKWINIAPKLKQIDSLFYNYDKEKILNQNYEYFVEGIFKLKCGNVSTKKQMISLKDNINMLERIEREYGSLDQFYSLLPAEKIARSLSDGKYKLKYIGYALAWEFMRNVGIDGAKPDLHIRRILGNDRLGYSNNSTAGELESINIIDRISQKSNFSKAFIDAVLWSYCADGYGQICTAEPKCNICVINKYCNKKTL